MTPTPSRPPFRVLVLCTGNSARSQIGEALLATRGAARQQGHVEAAIAGSRPAPRVKTPARSSPAARRTSTATYDALAARVEALLALPLEALAPDAMRDRAQAVHDRLAVPA